ncbi:hypothetical protein [Streptosporangium sp. LJ11]|uniref:hypothetical protein n=1 Tax=Streptosporangium sp. LJ11 TaxID=3436927 RepID=UPI003F78D5D6
MIVHGGRTSGASPEPAGLADTVSQPGFVGVEVPDRLRRRLAEGPGGVALYSRNLVDSEQIRALTAAPHAENPDLVIATDEEAGDVTRLEARTGSPVPATSRSARWTTPCRPSGPPARSGWTCRASHDET